MIADQNGEARLVPPIPNQPAAGWVLLNAHWVFGVALSPVQYSAYGVNSSALTETSGSSRHGVPAAASLQWLLPLPYVVSGFLTPGPCW